MKALLALALMAAPAAAKIVMMEPPVVMACRTAATMPALAKCLKDRGLVMTEIQALEHARLISVSTAGPATAIQSVALYLQDKKGAWQIGGLHELDGIRGEIAVTRFEKIGSSQHHGYRFDIATLLPSAYSPDDITSQPALYRQVEVNLCAGDSYSCTRVTESCAQYVQGQAIFAWLGSVAITGDDVKLTGTAIGPSSCGQPAAWTLAQLGFHS